MIIVQQIMDQMVQSGLEHDAASAKLKKSIDDLAEVLKKNGNGEYVSKVEGGKFVEGEYAGWRTDKVEDLLSDKRKEYKELSAVKLDPMDIRMKIETAIKSGKAMDEKTLLKVVEDYMVEKGEQGNKKMLDEFKKIVQDVLSKQGGSK